MGALELDDTPGRSAPTAAAEDVPGPSEKAVPPTTLAGEKGADMAGLGEKIGRFHSQLVLEVVGLRSELACLKKKKWILRAVLANGGESEQRAIDEEIAQLRQANVKSPK